MRSLNLDYVNSLDGQFLSLDNTLHVHQAGGVGSGDVFCPGGHVVADLVGAHACGYGRLLYGEHASEAAALIDPGRLHDLDAIYEGKQVPELGIMGDVQL